MTRAKIQLEFHNRKKLPVYRQDEIAECGHACVAMISSYWGHDINLADLRAVNRPSMKGINLSNIIQLCEQLKLRTRAIKVGLDALKLIRRPAILHWNMSHFVVLKKVTKNNLIIHDPASGERKLSIQDAAVSFTGIVLEIEPAQDFEQIRAQPKITYFDFFKNMKGLTQNLIMLLCLSLAIEIFALTNPLFMQYVTDHVLSSGDLHNLYVVAAGFLFLTVCHGLIEYIRSTLVVCLSSSLSEQLSSNVLGHLIKLPLDFFERRNKGDILSRFQSTHELQKKMTTDFIKSILDGLVILITLAVMLVYSRLLTTVVISILLFYSALRYLSYCFLKKQTELSISQHAKSNGIFLEILNSMMAIKSFIKENTVFNNWRNSFIHALNADINIAKTNLLYNTANHLLFNLDYIIVISIGARLIINHELSIGMLMAYLFYRQMLVDKSISLIQTLFEYQLISVQIERLSDIVTQKPESLAYRPKLPSENAVTLQTKNLSFRYNKNEEDIFQNLNLTVSAGEKVVITGPSGAGKSTLLKVIMGLFNHTEGEIFIDDIPLTIVGLKQYREITASVMQDDTLISGSITDNISFMDTQPDLERIVSVAKIASVHESILKLPMGYETLSGDMGSVLSGGEKQRILIARALYKQPKILFLDEATSHLDIETEIKINKALKALAITQISIAHRQETIKMADRIIDIARIRGG